MPRAAMPVLLALVLCLAGFGSSSVAAAEPEPVVILDFETGEPADGWRMRSIGLSEIAAPEGTTPSGGRALKLIEKEGQGSIRRSLSVSDWRTAAAVARRCFGASR